MEWTNPLNCFTHLNVYLLHVFTVYTISWIIIMYRFYFVVSFIPIKNGIAEIVEWFFLLDQKWHFSRNNTLSTYSFLTPWDVMTSFAFGHHCVTKAGCLAGFTLYLKPVMKYKVWKMPDDIILNKIPAEVRQSIELCLILWTTSFESS